MHDAMATEARCRQCTVPGTHCPSEAGRGGEAEEGDGGMKGTKVGGKREGGRENNCYLERESRGRLKYPTWLTLRLRNHSFISYRTGHYKLHYYETPTNLKFVMVTDTKSHNLRIVLHQIYVGLYVEYGMCFTHSACLWCENGKSEVRGLVDNWRRGREGGENMGMG